MNDKKVIDFTTGNPTKHILNFYWPLLLTSMLQQLYNFVDVMIVGKGLGDDAFASVGNMSSLFFLIVGFSFGLANGFGLPRASEPRMLSSFVTDLLELFNLLSYWPSYLQHLVQQLFHFCSD